MSQNPSTINQRVVEEYNDFQLMKTRRQRPYRQFNSAFDGRVRTLREYIDYSFAKFNQFVEYPEDSEDYEIQLALPNVRNKLMAILARLSAQRMKAEIHPQNIDQNLDKLVSRFLGQMLEWSDDLADQDKVNFYWMLETAMKGTGVLCEDYYKRTKEVKAIQEYDAKTGKSIWKKEKQTEDKCYSFVVPLEEFYVWNMREPDLDKQHKVIWATLMDFKEFQACFKGYAKAKDVRPTGTLAIDEETFYNDYLADQPNESVMVLRSFNQDTDEFKIIAGDVELTEENNPIPFKHKKAPFAKSIYEPIQVDFFYGKSLPDKLGNLSDAIDQLFNDLFNRNQMTLKAPLVAQEGSMLQDSVWRPDSILFYTGPNKPERLEVGGSSQDTERLFGILDSQLNLSSVSPATQGQTGSGSTAREVIIAQENANELMSMFLRFMEWGEKQRAYLRVSNLLQFMTKSASEKVTGDNYRVILQHSVELENGKIGTREIRLKSQKDITKPEVLEQEYAPDREIIEIPVELIKDLNFYIRIIPNSSIKISQALKKALDIEYANTMMQFFPNLVEQRALATEVTEAFEKNPDRLLIREGQTQEDTMMKQANQVMSGVEGIGGGVLEGMLQPENELKSLAAV